MTNTKQSDDMISKKELIAYLNARFNKLFLSAEYQSLKDKYVILDVILSAIDAKLISIVDDFKGNEQE